jgi:precorrin-6B methylase 2
MREKMIPERTKSSIKGLNLMLDYLEKQYGDLSQYTILEIGSWTGVSAVEFAKRFETVICVDPWEATEGINTKYDMSDVETEFNRKAKNYNNVKVYKETSYNYNKREDERYDFIYIDGCHTYEAVKQDIELWQDRVDKCICGHDYWPKKFDGVIKAVNECLGKPDKVFPDTSWIKAV